MSDKLLNLRDLQFILHEVLKIEDLTAFDYFSDHSRETFDMALDTAYALSRELFWPSYQECDRTGTTFDGVKTTVPQPLHEIWKACSEGGWFAPSTSFEHGGQQFPVVIHMATSYMFNAANTSASMYVGLTTGAANLIETYGSDHLKKTYMEKMFQGEWAGTMALTEPQAGTSLSDISTSAVKAPDGDYYLIKGIKRFISSGDHDLASNIIHLTLARIEGAPRGIKGISLFVVPKYRVNEDGSVGESNDVATGGIERKLGLKAQGTATLNYGENRECRGWLLGPQNEGLLCMFQMMNSARLFTGIQAVAQASCAYQCALQYCREREQGRAVANSDPTTPQVPIIEHAAVRRMLLIQKAHIEGLTSLLMYCAHCADRVRVVEDEDEKRICEHVLEILTPICKAHGSEMAYECISLAMQCYGGSGYIEEYPIAQLLRDSRVFPIYEGTNEVQAMDLLGRKVAAKQGAYFVTLMGEIGKTVAEASANESLSDVSAKVGTAMEQVLNVTQHLGQVGLGGDVNLYISHASPYLKILSHLVVAWQFLRQSIVADKALSGGPAEVDATFYQGKLATAKYYIDAILPTIGPLVDSVLAGERAALDFQEDWF